MKRSLTIVAATAALAGGLLVASTGPAGAATVTPKESSAGAGITYVQSGRGPWRAEVHSTRNQYSCTFVNAYSTARLALFRDPGSSPRVGVWVDTSADVHNALVLAGCRVKIFAHVVAEDGTVLQTVPSLGNGYDAFAGAVWDPQGSDHWYPKQGGPPWSQEAKDIDPLDIPLIDHVEITVQNAS